MEKYDEQDIFLISIFYSQTWLISFYRINLSVLYITTGIMNTTFAFYMSKKKKYYLGPCQVGSTIQLHCSRLAV